MEAASLTQPVTSSTPGITRPNSHSESQRTVQRIVVLGGGFAGLYVVQWLEKLFKHHAGVEITLMSRNNYFLMTPFLFEAGSGVLEPRHAVTPVRRIFKRARFIEAEVEKIDLEKKCALGRHAPGGHEYEIEFDHLVLALGGVTNRSLIPGADQAIAFKTLGDAIFLRNKIIDLFERADAEEDPEVRRRLLTIVVIGGGLVGVELMGELTEFIDNLLRSYPRLSREFVRFVLVEAHERILPEMEESLARYAAERLWRRGVNLITGTRVQRIERGKIVLPAKEAGDGQSVEIEAETILLAAGIAANPLLATLPVEKARNGRVVVDGAMRSKQHPWLWALGDCALIPDPKGNPYPPLAQHALREARVLAHNVAAAILGREKEIKPFVYETMGMLASLGHYDGVGRIGPVRVRGFLAWWVWRTYYMLQMPRIERKLRVVMDWTVALLFKNDVAKLDLFGERHPTHQDEPNQVERIKGAEIARSSKEIMSK